MAVSKTAARDVVRVFNKPVLNPVMLRLAGRRHFYASVVCHRGRRSGKAYRTPVVAEPVSDGFVIPLPYGDTVDWARNLQACGVGSLGHDGRVYPIHTPTIVAAAAAESELAPRQRRTFEIAGTRSSLHLDVAPH